MLENLTLVPSTIFGKCDEFADFSILLKNNRTNVLKFYQEYYSLEICKVITVIYRCKTLLTRLIYCRRTYLQLLKIVNCICKSRHAIIIFYLQLNVITDNVINYLMWSNWPRYVIRFILSQSDHFNRCLLLWILFFKTRMLSVPFLHQNLLCL
jgi:hypothetical protein